MRTGVVLLVVGLLLAGCGSPDGGVETPGSAGGKTRVDFTMFGDPVETAGYQEMVTAFEKDNPDVDVVLTPVASQDDLLARLVTAFAGGQPPDVFLINYRKYGQFASQGVLEPVQVRLDESEVIAEADFAPTAMDAFRFDDEALTCLPQNVSSLELYYNADLFKGADVPLPEAGWTWDEFLSAAKAMTRDDT